MTIKVQAVSVHYTPGEGTLGRFLPPQKGRPISIPSIQGLGQGWCYRVILG